MRNWSVYTHSAFTCRTASEFVTVHRPKSLLPSSGLFQESSILHILDKQRVCSISVTTDSANICSLLQAQDKRGGCSMFPHGVKKTVFTTKTCASISPPILRLGTSMIEAEYRHQGGPRVGNSKFSKRWIRGLNMCVRPAGQNKTTCRSTWPDPRRDPNLPSHDPTRPMIFENLLT